MWLSVPANLRRLPAYHFCVGRLLYFVGLRYSGVGMEVGGPLAVHGQCDCPYLLLFLRLHNLLCCQPPQFP